MTSVLAAEGFGTRDVTRFGSAQGNMSRAAQLVAAALDACLPLPVWPCVRCTLLGSQPLGPSYHPSIFVSAGRDAMTDARTVQGVLWGWRLEA